MSVRRLAILSFAVLVALEPAMLTAQSTVSYSTVTEQRLLNPEPHNWLMYRGTLNGWGYSPLDQVTPANVKKLVPVWTFSTGVNEGHQSPPIVNNGVMFVTTPRRARSCGTRPSTTTRTATTSPWRRSSPRARS